MPPRGESSVRVSGMGTRDVANSNFQFATISEVRVFILSTYLQFACGQNPQFFHSTPLRVRVGSAIIGPKGAHVQQLNEAVSLLASFRH